MIEDFINHFETEVENSSSLLEIEKKVLKSAKNLEKNTRKIPTDRNSLKLYDFIFIAEQFLKELFVFVGIIKNGRSIK